MVKDQFLSSMLEVDTVYHVTVAMCALTLSLNLSCLLVCAIQFLFAAKLVKSPNGRLRYKSNYWSEKIYERIIPNSFRHIFKHFL